MYAIIEDSGQQFRVSEGDVLRVDLRDLPAGAESVEFGAVLLVADGGNLKIGTPLVAGAKVVAKLEAALVAGVKVRKFVYKRRKGMRRTIGHRQKYTEVRVTQIVPG